MPFAYSIMFNRFNIAHAQTDLSVMVWPAANQFHRHATSKTIADWTHNAHQRKITRTNVLAIPDTMAMASFAYSKLIVPIHHRCATNKDAVFQPNQDINAFAMPVWTRFLKENWKYLLLQLIWTISEFLNRIHWKWNLLHWTRAPRISIFVVESRCCYR